MGGSHSSEYLARRSECHVLIVGGGYGGVHCAKALQTAEIPFTLVDPKEYFHHNIGGLRASLYPEYATQTAINYADTFGDSFVQGRVSDIDLKKKVAKVSNVGGDESTTKEVQFTYLVVATGSSGPFPGRARSTTTTKKDLIQEHKNVFAEIDKSRNIVVIGGGATGVELAGEIRDRFPNESGDDGKSVTLVHSGKALLQYDFGESMQTCAKSQLEKKGVKVMLGSRVKNLSELETDVNKAQKVVLESGDALDADLVFNCMGLRADVSLTKKIFTPGSEENGFFTPEGRLKVSPDLAVTEVPETEAGDFSHPFVFAVGDACNTDQAKMAAHAGDHGELVAKNIQRLLSCQPTLPYTPRFTGMIITIGKYGGVGKVYGYGLWPYLVSMLKGRTLFTPKYWALMGQTAPAEGEEETS